MISIRIFDPFSGKATTGSRHALAFGEPIEVRKTAPIFSMARHLSRGLHWQDTHLAKTATVYDHPTSRAF